MKKSNHKSGSWLMKGGVLLIAAALFLTAYNLWDEWRAGITAGQVLEQMPQNPDDLEASLSPGKQSEPDELLNPDMEMPVVEINGNDYIGILDIPILELSLPVMSEWSYPKLRIAPCRYSGSAYENHLIIAAHNYRTHFGRIGSLCVGDRVIFTDVDGNIFLYSVAEIQTLAPTSVEEMLDDGWDLTLFTCTLGGRTRVTVRCELVGTEIKNVF